MLKQADAERKIGFIWFPFICSYQQINKNKINIGNDTLSKIDTTKQFEYYQNDTTYIRLYKRSVRRLNNDEGKRRRKAINK